MNQTDKAYAHAFTGDRFDTGNKFSWLKANIKYGLKRSDMSDALKDYIIELGQSIK